MVAMHRLVCGGKVLLYNVIEVATYEVKCGKVYSADDFDFEATVTAEIEGSSEQCLVLISTLFVTKLFFDSSTKAILSIQRNDRSHHTCLNRCVL